MIRAVWRWLVAFAILAAAAFLLLVDWIEDFLEPPRPFSRGGRRT